MIVWLIIVKGQYKSVEKVFLAASFFYITYIVAGVLAKPAWIEALTATIKPPQLAAFKQDSYLYMVIGVVGTTIAPWMQFYLQSSIVEKGVTRRQYKTSKLDVIVGCIFTDVVAWFIIVACAATLYVHGHSEIRDAADAAQALRPWRVTMLTSFSRWDFSMPRFSPRRFSRFRRRTRSAKGWGLSPESGRSFLRRPHFIGSTRF